MIRRKFAETNSVGVEWFSFNSKGACPVCGGRGVIKPEIAFADPVEMIAAADWVIEMGPRGGSQGGRVVFTGIPEELIQAKDSLTGQYMKANQ